MNPSAAATLSLITASTLISLPLLAGLFASPARAQSAPQPLGCLIEPQSQAEVGSPLIGVVESVAVERGQAVRKGQVLATMRNEVERANVAAARSRATAEAEIQAAAANRDVAKIKWKRTVDLHNLGFAALLEVDQTKGEYEVADQRLAQARETKTTAERELSGAEAQLRQRTVRSPIDGVIVDRLVQPGERIDGKPIFRVAALNPLRVEVIIPSSLYGQVREGMQIAVQPEFAGAGSVNSHVVQVDRIIDAASGTFRARLTMPNAKGDIPAGVRCKLAMTGLEPTAAAASAAASAATAASAAASATASATPSGQSPTTTINPTPVREMNFKAEAPRIQAKP